MPPHDDEPNKGNKDSYSGGPHKDTSKPTGDGLDSHHCPAKSCYKDAPISSEDGPAIKMDPEDHQKTSSYGNSDSAKSYRAKQKKLIDEGKFLDAVQMDADDIKNVEEKTGQLGKYDNAIKEMLDYAKNLNVNDFKKE